MNAIRRELRKHDARMKGGFNDWRVFGDIGPRPHTCQYIARDPRVDATKCGAPVRPGSVYCASHHARCYRKAEEVES